MIKVIRNIIISIMVLSFCIATAIYSSNGVNIAQAQSSIPKTIKDSSKLPSNLYFADGGCDYLINHYIPEWAPKNHWKIHCIDNFGKNAGGLNGETFPKYNLILIKKDKNNETVMKVILHEWTHASVAEYRLRKTKQWQEWVNYVNHIKGHKKGYYGLPEEILAENVPRCSLGFEYLNTGYNIASCKTIHDLFPVFNTVDSKTIINTNLN